MDVDSTSPEAMLTFYRRLYPFKSIFQWLNHEHSPARLFTHREFAFTLPGDVYLRYNSFNTLEDLKKQVCLLNPSRFEIGPVYTARPQDRKTVRSTAFTPVQRELVFDIDMTDYDPIRTCCSGTDMCKRCWGFISAAVHVLDSSIRNHFGYKHLLWVYSGRRGIHLWISDQEAMNLTDQQRKAVVGWMTVITGGKESGNFLNINTNGTRSLPLSLSSALDILTTKFDKLILEDQNCFMSEAGYETLLQFIPDASIVENLRKDWKDKSISSSDKWTKLKREVRNSNADINHVLKHIILFYTYPRLDAEVSKHRNHLLKAPFCVHPKTGRVCVPVDPKEIEVFDPENVPTVGQLIRELDTIHRANEQEMETHADWERTSLKPYIDMLDKHALEIMVEVRKQKRIEVTW